MLPSVSDFRLGNISAGYASVFYKEKRVGVLEKFEKFVELMIRKSR